MGRRIPPARIAPESAAQSESLLCRRTGLRIGPEPATETASPSTSILGENVTGMTKVAALGLGRHGIRVNSVHPGGIRTPTASEALGEPAAGATFSTIPPGRIGEPEEVVMLALFLASDESSYSTGSEFVVDGGWTCGFALATE